MLQENNKTIQEQNKRIEEQDDRMIEIMQILKALNLEKTLESKIIIEIPEK